MKLAIIAAGEGSRLREEGINILKPMVEVNGEKLIDRLFRIALENDFQSICCIVNEESKEIAKYLLKQKSVIPIDVKIKSTPSSLHSLKELGKFIDHPFILTTVDSVFNESDFTRFVKYVSDEGENYDSILGITDFIDDEKPLCVELNDRGNVISFHNEKGSHNWATGGIYFFKPNIFEEINSVIDSGLHRLRNFLNHMLQQNYTLGTFKFSKIIDVDHVEDIKKAEELIRNHETII